MNKKIFIFLISLFSFISIDNVKAWSSDNYINVNYNDSVLQEKMSEYSEFINFMDNNIINKLNSDSYDYFVNLRFDSDKLNYCVTQKKNENDKFQIRSLFEYGTSSGLQMKPNDLNKRYYCYNSTDFSNDVYTSENIYNYLESSSFSTGSSMWNYASVYYYIASGTSSIKDDIYNDVNYSSYSANIIYYSNTDISIIKYDDGTFLPIKFNNENISYVDDKFYTYLDLMDKTPTISFNVVDNKETINGEEIITSKDLTVNFSIIDNENYRYLISFDNGENWSSITIDDGNSMTFNINDNKTVYVQVKKASDYSMVTSATYTIDGITNIDTIKPKIDYSIISEEKGHQSENVYIVSKTLRTTFGLIDTSKYVYSYSLDGENWKTIKFENNTNYFDLKFNKNETVRTKILYRDTASLVTSATYTVGGITGYKSSTGKIYNNLLKIPITDLYKNNLWDKYQFVFMSNTSDTYNYDLYIELVPYSGVVDNKPIPLQLYMSQEIQNINTYFDKIINSPTTDPDGYGGGFTMNGGSFGGGGGGGRFDDNDEFQSCTTFPVEENGGFTSKLNYKVVSIIPNNCSDISSFTPSDFTTEYIYIYYNARMYETIKDALDDENNTVVSDDNIFFEKILKPILDLVNKKMPIIGQLNDILKSFQYVDEIDTPPQFNIDLKPLGIPYKGPVIDFSFYAENRDTIFYWLKIIFATKTLIKIIHIVKNAFRGW